MVDASRPKRAVIVVVAAVVINQSVFINVQA
jgi:hypothetical protein